jgi:hypothetical protein
MTNLIFDGEKFALIAFETRSAVDLPLTELTPGLWASSASMIDLGQFWKDELGKNRTRDLPAHKCHAVRSGSKASREQILLEKMNKYFLRDTYWRVERFVRRAARRLMFELPVGGWGVGRGLGGSGGGRGDRGEDEPNQDSGEKVLCHGGSFK